FTEFSYMLLQAYDFLELYSRYGCTLQLGGSDQWGNITAGIELIRRARGGAAHGIVQPLVTTASGAKFGKTEAGTVWLDAERTSPFRFYQFWLNADDRDAEHWLKAFTFLPLEEIGEVMAAQAANPAARAAQRRLAEEVTALVHGADGLARADRATAGLLGRRPAQDLPAAELLEVSPDVTSTELPRARFEGDGMRIVELLDESGLASSRGDARRLVAGGGVYLNGERVADVERRVTLADAIDGAVVLLRKGRKENRVVRLAG